MAAFTRLADMNRQARSKAAAGVVAVVLHVLALWALFVTQLGGVEVTLSNPLRTMSFELPERPPSLPPKPQASQRASRPKDAPAPPNLTADPTPLVLPDPVITLPVPPLLTIAPIAGLDAQSDAGAAALAGPGTGAGGEGTGRGGGGTEGTGGADDDRTGWTAPRQIKGRLKNSDFVRSDEEDGVSRRVGVRYLVEIDGRVSECEVTKPSGNAALDETACRLIKERFRFRPSKNPLGQPVPAYIVENHSWLVEKADPDAKNAKNDTKDED